MSRGRSRGRRRGRRPAEQGAPHRDLDSRQTPRPPGHPSSTGPPRCPLLASPVLWYFVVRRRHVRHTRVSPLFTAALPGNSRLPVAAECLRSHRLYRFSTVRAFRPPGSAVNCLISLTHRFFYSWIEKRDEFESMFVGQTLHSPSEMRRLWTAAPWEAVTVVVREESRLGVHPARPGGAEAGRTSLTVICFTLCLPSSFEGSCAVALTVFCPGGEVGLGQKTNAQVWFLSRLGSQCFLLTALLP